MLQLVAECGTLCFVQAVLLVGGHDGWFEVATEHVTWRAAGKAETSGAGGTWKEKTKLAEQSAAACFCTVGESRLPQVQYASECCRALSR